MIERRKSNIPAVLISGATLFSVPLPVALAQESLTLEEVYVTARRRSESLQDAPLAVSALTGDALLDAGITNLADITEMVPNLQISRPSRDASIYVRGVGPTRGATNVTELSVGVYIDDVFLLKPHGQLMDLAEIESVQVLRGPQGTLFGKNTTGGALVVTTVKPAEEFGGFAQVTAGNDGRFNVQASVDVPLNDKLLSKLTVTSVQADGFFKDPVHGTELSDEDRLGGLLQLRWLVSDDVTVDFSLFHNRIRENLLAMGDCVVTNLGAQIPANGLVGPGDGGPKFLPDFCEEVNTIHDGKAPYYDPSSKFELDATQVSINLNWEYSENHSFKSVTAWRTQETPDITYTNTYAGYPAGQGSLEDGESTQFSQEFQLSGDFMDGSLRYTAGLYYMDDDSDTGSQFSYLGDQGIWGAIGGDVPAGLVAGQANLSVTGQENLNKTFAAFTQWSWDVTDNLELTAGLRYGYEERDLKTERAENLLPWEVYADVPGAIILPGVAALLLEPVYFGLSSDTFSVPLGETEFLETDENFDSLTPMFTAAYNFAEESLGDSINGLMIYASYTEGYKAGGFSDFGVGELVPFDEESIDSIELGFKLDAWDNRLRINAAVFTMNYEDMQLFVARPDPDPNNIGSLQGVTNAGASSIDGAELELTLLPAEGWLINFSASYADGKFDEFDDFIVDGETGETIPLDRSDEALPSLPETAFSLGLQYDWDTSIGSFTARVDAFYRDEIYWGFDALTWDIPLARQESTTDSYTVYNARFNWAINERLSIAAWGKNLADKTYYDGGVGEAANLGHVVKAFSPPRRYGVDVRYDF
jgi:iron complex outermembrane receptor protein